MTDESTTAQNRQLLQNIFAELAQGNSRPLVDSMADSFRWTITGDASWSRTYDGKKAVVGELFAALRAKLAVIRTTAHRILADGDHVVVEARGDHVTHDGKPYRNSYCFICRVAAGKLAELTEYMDSELATTMLGPPPN